MENKKFLADFNYLLALANPFSKLVHMQDDLLKMQIQAFKGDVVGRVIFKTGYWDPVFSRWLQDYLRGKPGWAIDVGANLGYFTLLMADAVGDKGKVISIEPEPENISLLRKNLKNNRLSNVLIEEVAVSNTQGFARLNRYKNSNRGRHSLVSHDTSDYVNVPIRTLDEIIEQHIPKDQEIQFIKIDIEGYEPFAVEGLAKNIHRVRTLSIEWLPNTIKSNEQATLKMLQKLSEHFNSVSLVTTKGITPYNFKDLVKLSKPHDLIFGRV